MFDLSGKLALVTGSSRGIGKAIAIALAKAREGVDEFVSIDDFAQKAGASSSTVEVLRQVGAFGDLPETRQMSLFDF